MTFPGFFQKKARRPERFFTLIEVLAAMAVLSLLMLMLFQFFASAQRAWSNTEANNEVFENARVVFDLLQRDLQGARAKAGDIAGQDLKFSYTATDQLLFVSAGDPSSSATCELLEVGYKVENNVIKRAVLDNSSAAWTPYGNRRKPADVDATKGAYQEVAAGVLSLDIKCVPPDMLILWTPGVEGTKLPAAVMVQIKLLDRKSFELWKQLPATPQAELVNRRARVFSKTIFLSGRPQ